MSVYRRNGMAATEDNDGLVLMHHWNAKDDLVNNRWMDRVTGTAYFPMQQSWVEEEGMHLRQGDTSTLAGMPGTLDLGRRFRVEVDARATIVPKSGFQYGTAIMISLQSYGGFTRGFAMGLAQKTQCFTVNDVGARPSVSFGRDFLPIRENEPIDGVFTLDHIPVDVEHDVWRFRFGDIDLVTDPFGNGNMDGIHQHFVKLNTGSTATSWDGSYYLQDILYREIRIYVAQS